MNVLCMRHGQSEYNILGLCNDDPGKNVRLTALGRRQAEQAAEKIANIPLERIFCSELPRTRETAMIINRHHNVPIQTHAGLNDVHSGCDSRPVTEYLRAIASDLLNTRVGDGETLLEHKRRVTDFIGWLAGQPYSTVLVVAHEETLRVFYACQGGLDHAEMVDLQFENCEILTLEF